MQLVTLKINTQTSTGSVGNLRNADGMKLYFEDPKNAKFIIIGRFLAKDYQGKTLAQHLLDGETLDLASFEADGFTYPLRPGYSISLKDITSWACPACGSAPGTGFGKSAGIAQENKRPKLESAKWYYNVATQTLHVISPNCWDNYVKATGQANRFVPPYDLNPKPVSKAPTTAQQAHEQRVEQLFPGSGKPQEKFAEPKGAKK